MAQDLELFTIDIYVAIENAIEIVVDKIIKVMQAEIDAQKIGIASNNEVYNPTGQFKQSWIPMVKQRLGLIVEGGMEYEPNMMSSVPNIFQHGSNIPTENDSREYLDDILFYVVFAFCSERYCCCYSFDWYCSCYWYCFE